MERLKQILVLAVIAVPMAAAADHGAGKLIAARAAQVQPRTTRLYATAVVNQTLFAGDGVRTLRRGFADIRFLDTSEIRLNERTDLVIEDSYTMRRYALGDGALWVRVAKGVRTVVRTPVGTATARGTVFTITAEGRLTVLEGSVEYEVNGQTTTVHAGESVDFAPKYQTFISHPDPYHVIQTDSGFTDNGWFDHPGELSDYPDPGDTPFLGDVMRYQWDTDGTALTENTSLAQDAEGVAAIGIGAEIGSQLFVLQGYSHPNVHVTPEPGIPVAMLAGAGVFALKRTRKPR